MSEACFRAQRAASKRIVTLTRKRRESFKFLPRSHFLVRGSLRLCCIFLASLPLTLLVSMPLTCSSKELFNPQNIPFLASGVVPLNNINSSTFNDIDPTLSPDGSLFLFSSDTSGNYDIYQAGAVDSDGIPQGTPTAVTQLNSTSHDVDPAFTPDGKYIFFASDRPGGRGKFDIYYSQWFSNTSFSSPLPLSSLINSPVSEGDPSLVTVNGSLYLFFDRDKKEDSNTPIIDESADSLDFAYLLYVVLDPNNNFAPQGAPHVVSGDILIDTAFSPSVFIRNIAGEDLLHILFASERSGISKMDPLKYAEMVTIWTQQGASLDPLSIPTEMKGLYERAGVIDLWFTRIPSFPGSSISSESIPLGGEVNGRFIEGNPSVSLNHGFVYFDKEVLSQRDIYKAKLLN